MSDLLVKIQQDLEKEGLDGVLISRNDPFLTGYYPPYKNRLKKVTGFTGSEGVALVLKDRGILFVDSRYTEQAKEQSSFEVLEVPRDTRLSLWIKENMKGKKIAFDALVHSFMWHETLVMLLKESNVSFVPLKEKTLSSWFKKKKFKQESFDYSIEYAGLTSKEKLSLVQRKIQDLSLDAMLVLSPENTSWLLNKRAKTKSDYPVVYEQLFVPTTGNVQSLSLKKLKGLKVGVDFSKASYGLITRLLKNKINIQNTPEFIDDLKAQKNNIEIQNIKEACLFESSVICKFLVYVEKNKSKIIEIDCDKKLRLLRQKNPLYFYESFQTIAASGVHAALAHYLATKESAFDVKDNPLLLVDTGGHYLNGTTDMTRTIVVGEPSSLMKKRYTQVLKGHIGVSTSAIKVGASSASMDEKAHAYLRADGVDFYHSTGHGIGMMLGVHEYPPAVYSKDTKGILPGMVFSNEPAFYSVEEKFGIRLENMLLSVTEGENLIFEDLLFIPFDYRAVEFDLLTKEEKIWLKNYHQQIKEKVFPLLTKEERKTLTPFVEAFMKG
ncbi:MAG: M24 family metallopeptidase [Alphaproteobacteria bacterium]|nr:M24 family metallopeptidase [Alphaproteobacteria bacterium]